MKATNILEKSLRDNRYSVTSPRTIIFGILDQSKPLSMSEIVASASPEVDRASVYRTVALFEKLGIVQRLQIGWKYKLELSDAFHQHHHHIVCLRCGKIINIHEPKSLELQLETIAKNQHFKLVGHQLELHGLCETCRKNHVTPAT